MQTHTFRYNDIEARLCDLATLGILVEAAPYTIGIFLRVDEDTPIARFIRDGRDWSLKFERNLPFGPDVDAEDFMFVAKEGYDFLQSYDAVNKWH